MGSGAQSLIDGLFGVLFIMLGAVGDYLDRNPMGGYMCPRYCAVEHKHIMEKNGHISDNRDTGDTCSCSCGSSVGLHVSDKVHTQGCCKGPKGTLRDNCKINRHKQNSKGRN